MASQPECSEKNCTNWVVDNRDIFMSDYPNGTVTCGIYDIDIENAVRYTLDEPVYTYTIIFIIIVIVIIISIVYLTRQ
jgi:hypothetical protein